MSSWLQALYSTSISMSTAGELTTKSSKGVWVLGALNSLVGLLFFGFIVWLVTTSLYQDPDALPGAAKEYFFRLHRSGLTADKRVDTVNWAAIAVGEPVQFNAVQFGKSGWYASGPVVVKAPEALPNAGWTVSTGRGEMPIIVGNVGRSLDQGEDFALPVTDTVIGGVLVPIRR
jgi:hypothetical protein